MVFNYEYFLVFVLPTVYNDKVSSMPLYNIFSDKQPALNIKWAPFSHFDCRFAESKRNFDHFIRISREKANFMLKMCQVPKLVDIGINFVKYNNGGARNIAISKKHVSFEFFDWKSPEKKPSTSRSRSMRGKWMHIKFINGCAPGNCSVFPSVCVILPLWGENN